MNRHTMRFVSGSGRLLLIVICLTGSMIGASTAGALAPSSVSDDLGDGRAGAVKSNVAHDLEPGAIGNGTPLVNLVRGVLPPRIAALDSKMVGKLHEAIDMAIMMYGKNGTSVPAEYAARAEEAVRTLVDLRNTLSKRLYLFNAVVNGNEEYLVGFNYGDQIGLSAELVDRLYAVSPVRLAQYIFHECVQEKGLEKGRDDHRVVYARIQSAIFGQNEVVALGNNIRSFIDERSQALKPTVAAPAIAPNKSAALPDNDQYWTRQTMFEPLKEDDPQPEWLVYLLRQSFSPDDRGLEIACGSGRAMERLIRAGLISVEGIDINEAFIEMARRRGIAPEKATVMNIKTADLKGAYKYILANDILLYLDPKNELPAVMKKIAAALQEGGTLAIRWAAGADNIVNKVDRYTYHASQQFLLDLMKSYGIETVVLEQRDEPIYVSGAKSAHCVYWYLVARKPLAGDRASVAKPRSIAGQLLVSNMDSIEKLISFMAVRDPLPERADVIMALGRTPEMQAIPEKTAELYFDYRRKGGSPKIVVSGFGPANMRNVAGYVPEAERYQQYLLGRGIPAEDIIVEKESTSIKENIALSKVMIDGLAAKGNSVENVILVQGAFDQRYADPIFRQGFGRAPINYAAGVPDLGALSEEDLYKAVQRAYVVYARLAINGPRGTSEIGEVPVPADVLGAVEKVGAMLRAMETERALVLNSTARAERGLHYPIRLAKAEAEIKMRVYERLGKDFGIPLDEDVGLAAALIDAGEDFNVQIGDFVERNGQKSRRLIVSPIPASDGTLKYRAMLFKASIIRLAQRYPDRKFILAIDTDIGKEQKAQIMPLYKAADQIKEIKDSQGRGLSNLMVIRGSAGDLMAQIQSNVKDPGGVFIVTSARILGSHAYEGMQGKAWIASIDDVNARANVYLPVFETATVSIMAALGADVDSIKRFYDTISEKPIAPDALQDMVARRLIYILPRAMPMKDLRDAYERMAAVSASA